MEETQPEQELPDDIPVDSEPEEEEPPEARPKPAFVINFYSWTTPILAVLMLLIGLAGGYFGRPLLEGRLAAAPAATPTAAASQAQDANAAALMAKVVADTRHFKGNPDAPVTIVEYSDYQ